jgi:hypothetical protein
MPENAGAEKAVEEATQETEVICSVTMEQQLQRIRAIAEQEDRANFMAKVDAHARATQALRQAKQTIHESQSSKPKKRRVVPTPKRRAHSASKVSTH